MALPARSCQQATAAPGSPTITVWDYRSRSATGGPQRARTQDGAEAAERWVILPDRDGDQPQIHRGGIARCDHDSDGPAAAHSSAAASSTSAAPGRHLQYLRTSRHVWSRSAGRSSFAAYRTAALRASPMAWQESLTVMRTCRETKYLIADLARPVLARPALRPTSEMASSARMTVRAPGCWLGCSWLLDLRFAAPGQEGQVGHDRVRGLSRCAQTARSSASSSSWSARSRLTITRCMLRTRSWPDYPAGVTGPVHAGPRVDADVAQPGLPVQLSQAAADEQIGAVPAEGGAEELPHPGITGVGRSGSPRRSGRRPSRYRLPRLAGPCQTSTRPRSTTTAPATPSGAARCSSRTVPLSRSSTIRSGTCTSAFAPIGK